MNPQANLGSPSGILTEARDRIATGDPLDAAQAAAVLSLLDIATRRQRRAAEAVARAKALQHRDTALRAAAALLPGRTVRARALELIRRIKRYRACAWVDRDQFAATCPPRLEGTVEGWLWRAMKFDDRLPTGDRQIRQIIS